MSAKARAANQKPGQTGFSAVLGRRHHALAAGIQPITNGLWRKWHLEMVVGGRARSSPVQVSRASPSGPEPSQIESTAGNFAVGRMPFGGAAEFQPALRVGPKIPSKSDLLGLSSKKMERICVFPGWA